jgi:dCMP deaminase
VLATGYNGTPAGADHCNDIELMDWNSGKQILFPNACPGAAQTRSGSDLDSCDAVHAEQNAILQCADSYAIAKAYVTAFPCVSCAKLLLNTSCREVVYLDSYGDGTSLNQWVKAGRLAVRFGGEPPMIQRDLVRLFGCKDALNEWRVIVACTCLNLCSARVARGVVMRILNRWPRPSTMAGAGEDLERMLKPLGLSEKRASTLRGASASWGIVRIEDMKGVGLYALESVKVFCRDELPDNVGDRKVAAWVAWRRDNGSKV